MQGKINSRFGLEDKSEERIREAGIAPMWRRRGYIAGVPGGNLGARRQFAKVNRRV